MRRRISPEKYWDIILKQADGEWVNNNRADIIIRIE
jgi:hypothetical protein